MFLEVSRVSRAAWRAAGRDAVRPRRGESASRADRSRRVLRQRRRHRRSRAPVTRRRGAGLPAAARRVHVSCALRDPGRPHHQRQRLRRQRLRRLRLFLLEQDQQPRRQRHDADRRRPQSRPRRQRADAVHATTRTPAKRATPDRCSTPNSSFSCATAEGWYFSATRPTALYLGDERSAHAALRRAGPGVRDGLRRDEPARRRQVPLADALEQRRSRALGHGQGLEYLPGPRLRRLSRGHASAPVLHADAATTTSARSTRAAAGW